MTSFWQDLRYGAQMLMKHPAFTAVAVLTLALGVGANTALFSVVDAVLLKKLPVKDPDQLVLFKASWNFEKFEPGSFDGSNYHDLKTKTTTGTSFPIQTLHRLQQEKAVLSDVFAFSPRELNFNAGGQAEVVNGQVVSGNYYAALGVPAVVGRIITDADDNATATPVAVLSHRFWTNRFGADPSIVGKQVNINNVAFTIVGVSAAEFAGTSNVGTAQDVSIPLAWEQQVAGEQSNMLGAGIWWLRLMGRLQPGASLAQAEATLAGPFEQSVLEHRDMRQARAKRALSNVDPKDLPRLGVDSGSQGEMDSRSGFAVPLYLLVGVVGLVLLIACANVANLLLVRGSWRKKEIAVRLALGASRGRLIRQLLTESVLLATVGGALGILFALWIKNGLLLVAEWGGREMNALDPQLDLRVLAFTLGLSLLTGIVFGVLPALRSTDLDLTPALKDTGRSSSALGRSWLSKSLVVVQVSLSVLLLIGAGTAGSHTEKSQASRDRIQRKQLASVRPRSWFAWLQRRKAGRALRTSFQPGRSRSWCAISDVLTRCIAVIWSSPRAQFLCREKLDQTANRLESEAKVHTVRENFLSTMEIPLLDGAKPLRTG